MYIERQADKKIKELLETKKILLVLGARQVGKTTSVKNFLINKKFTYLNLDIEVDKNKLLAAFLLNPADAYEYFGRPDYLVIDEAQREIKTAQIVKGWYDANTAMRIILLGSSSLNLLNQSAESLTGRNEKLFLSPLVFKEVIASQEWFSENFTKDILLSNFSQQIHYLLMSSLIFGSYPEAVTTWDKERFLLNLVSDYLFKDVLQLGLVKSPELIKRLLLLLAHQIGSEVSINELANSLNISRQTIERYFDILEQTYVIFRLRSYSTNPRKEISKSQKIYFYDTGVRNALLKEFSLSETRSDIGALWENWVIAEFMKNNLLDDQRKNIYFWRSRSLSEVDLVIKDGEALSAYEIKWKRLNVVNKAFEDQYKVKVKIINNQDPLFL
jgi:hypothetical protein